VTASTGCLADIADLADVEGCAVLDAVADFLARFIAYPSEHARYAHALWLAHTWRMDEWDSTPRLAFMSPEKGSGKTRSLEVSEHLVPRAVRVSQATAGYVLAKVSQEPPPTLFYDEIDTVYGQNARGNEDLRAVLNAGHRRGATASRGSWGPDGPDRPGLPRVLCGCPRRAWRTSRHSRRPCRHDLHEEAETN